MWELRACRSCLSLKSKLEKINEHTKRIYSCITGITIADGDGYPNFFCIECTALMKRFLSARRKMRRAFFVMKEIMLKKQQVSYFELSTVDRRRTNLRSAIGYWRPQSTGFFKIKDPEFECDNVNADNITAIDNDAVQPLINVTLPLTDAVLPVADAVLPLTSEVQAVEGEREKPNALREYKPVCNGHVRHVIDIKPDKEVFLRNMENVIENEPLVEDVESHSADDPQEPVEEINENIDLTNVFENFVEEDNCESDYSLPDEFPTKKNKKNERKEQEETEKKEDIQYKTKKSYNTIKLAGETLSLCDIEVCSVEQQLRIFETRKKLVPYATATYKCGICLTVYKDLGELKEHVKKHNSMEKYAHMCTVCYLKYPTEELLELHVSENHKYLYKCRQCDGKELYTLKELVAHGELHRPRQKSEPDGVVPGCRRVPLPQEHMGLKMAHRGSRLRCEACHMSFDRERLLRVHAEKHAQDAGSLLCDICSTWHKSLDQLTRHMRLYHLYKYECQHCPEVFFNKFEALHHSSEAKHSDLNKVKCQHCGKMLKPKGIHCHIYKRHRASAFVHDCVACGRGFQAGTSLYIHQFKEHNMLYVNDPSAGEEAARCKVCDIQFLSVTAYRQHAARKKHEDAQFFENTCSICFKMYDTEEAYNRHMELHSGPKYPRECSYCGKWFETRKRFYAHQAKWHAAEDPEYRARRKLCELCGEWVFLWSKHMLEHTGASHKFACEHCTPPRVFPDGIRLVRHVLSSHTPLPHVCTLCGHRFQGRQECLDHILKLHAPEHAFKCASCSRRFSHRDFLIEHAKKAHGVTMKRKPQYTSAIKCNIVVYPHMKINMSLVKPQVLKTLKIKLLNYDNTRREVLDDYKDYVITDEVDNILDESEPKKRKLKWNLDGLENEDGEPAKRRSKRTKTEPGLTVNVKKRRIKSKKIEEDTRESDENEILNTYVINDKERKRVKQIVKEAVAVDDSEMQGVTDTVQENSNGDLIVDEQLQVFEENGEQFVLINGVVYKVESS